MTCCILKNIKRAWRRLRCPHRRTFCFYPENAYANLNHAAKGMMHHGATIEACMDCGAVWGRDYAE